MKIGPKSLNFYEGQMKEICTFQATVLKFYDLLTGWKLATNAKFKNNISKIIPARPKKHRDIGCEYYIKTFHVNNKKLWS